MKGWARNRDAFTIVELLIVVTVIAIIAAITIVAYSGIQKQAATTLVMAAAKDAVSVTESELSLGTITEVNTLPTSYEPSPDVTIAVTPLSSVHYSNLSTVQHGVLMYEICEDLIADPYYSTIHSANGAQTNSIVMSCDDNVQDDRMQITGWETRTWVTPVTQQQIQDYLASVAYDSWWVDKQEVIRRFYNAMIARYTSAGGTWPITSFWDPWANQYSGVPKQDLPAPDATSRINYCITVTHNAYPDISYVITAEDQVPRVGACY